MQPSPDTPFRILVLGDFSGRGSRDVHEPEGLSTRRIHRVDRDDFDELFGRLGVAVRMPMTSGAEPIGLTFRELDDLHPDHLYTALPQFEELRDLRRRLDNPATFAEAAGELGAPPAAVPPVSEPAAEPDDLLAATLKATEDPGGRSSTGSELVDALLREIVIPHATPGVDPRSAELVASVDKAISAHMQSLLHHPSLRGVEAAWRGLELLVRRLETGTSLQLHVLDISRDELDADLASPQGLEASRLFKRLVEETVGVPGAEPWTLCLGVFSFDATAWDAAVLSRLAQLSAAAGVAFVAAADSHLAGCESLSATPDPDDWCWSPDETADRAWGALRQLPAAAHVGLVLPRLLLRSPYGERAGTVERFDFEELADAHDHESYLWGSGAFAAGLLLGEAFTRNGWGLQVDESIEIDGLPADVRERDGEPTLQPAAEVLLTDRAAGILAERGLSVLRSVRGQDVVQLHGLRSIGGAPLAGLW